MPACQDDFLREPVRAHLLGLFALGLFLLDLFGQPGQFFASCRGTFEVPIEGLERLLNAGIHG